MRKKRTYIILIAIILIFFVVMFLLFGVDNIKQEGYETTIIVGENTIWTYSDKRWKNTNSSYDKLNWKKYDIYLNNEKNGKYYLWHSDKWYAFDDNKNAVMLDGDLLAYDANYNISVYNFNYDDIENFNYVHNVLEDNSLPTTSEFTSSHVVFFDFDADGEEEEFYVISNAFPMDFDPEKIFSLVFMVKNDDIYPIYIDVSNNVGFNGCKPYFTSFLDIDDDSNYELILSCAKYSTAGTTDMLYKFDNNEFKLLISNNN